MRFAGYVVSVGLLFLARQGLAADSSSGCGPGWYIFKENSILSSTLRTTTNAALFPVYTLGMTFGTSNCAKHSLVLEDKRSLHFATQSYELLRQDVAQGSGPHLSAYIATFGCNASVSPALAQQMQAAFRHELYLTIEPSAFVETTRTLIERSQTLAAACS